nr:hypothetical protein B0A51_06184 [Rachicladosporium sp. CCFEE 5018]
MWLINVASGVLTEFDNEDPPLYAIFSHRWGPKEQEQTFKEYRKGLKHDTTGHEKILKLRETALADGQEWVWIDTACIDKRSSAELSEAINSMFTWYRNAAKCYALLSDVHDVHDDAWKSSEW